MTSVPDRVRPVHRMRARLAGRCWRCGERRDHKAGVASCFSAAAGAGIASAAALIHEQHAEVVRALRDAPKGDIQATKAGAAAGCDHLWALYPIPTFDGSPWGYGCNYCQRQFWTVEDFEELFG